MTEHFNGLTPAQTERLDMLQEECAEVIKAGAKIKRHGYGSFNPDDPEAGDNRQQLMAEFADVLAMYEMLMDAGEVVWPSSTDIMAARLRKLKYAHHQGPPNDR